MMTPMDWHPNAQEMCDHVSRGSPEHAAFTEPMGDASGEPPPEGLSWVSTHPTPTPSFGHLLRLTQRRGTLRVPGL
jgi:hypothetical protein